MTNNNFNKYDDLEEIEFSKELSDSFKQPKSAKSTPKQSISIFQELLSYVKLIVIAIIIAFICTQFIIVNAKVPTGSMRSTIMEDDRLIGFRLSYLFSTPQRGDIVIFKFPDDETQNYIKRVIGLPGDIVTIENGAVYINGDLLEENYLNEPMITNDTKTFVVPASSYFMMGDNRNNSYDARYWTNTFVSKDKVLAKAIFKYYDGTDKNISFSLIK